jgi:hypothetical protein
LEGLLPRKAKCLWNCADVERQGIVMVFRMINAAFVVVAVASSPS